jgi:hypothetical protein
MQDVCFALDFALLSAGNNIAARIAMIAITTNNSISVKPPELLPQHFRLILLFIYAIVRRSRMRAQLEPAPICINVSRHTLFR